MKVIEKDLTSYFPTIETVDRLGTLCGVAGEFKPFFYDIETTGLARKTTNLYLIGVVFPDGEHWVMRQWFAEGPEEEEAILEKFVEFSKAFSHTVQFNGNKFDAPYIRERCSVYGLESPLDSVPGLDLYQFLKPIRLLLQLDHMRQADVEEFLHLPDRIYPDGKVCIKHYRDYVGLKRNKDLEICLGHNEEDLIGMGRIFVMLNYQGLLNGLWEYESVIRDGNDLIFTVRLAYPLPREISGGIPGVYMHAKDTTLRILTHIKHGRLQQFYTNYKDYDYLPAEDTAIHKSLGTYIDKSLKQACTLETCYTWFPFSEDFLAQKEKHIDYLRHTIPFMIVYLSK